MRIIGHAMEQYNIQNNRADNNIPDVGDINNYIRGGIPTCPSDSSAAYNLGYDADTGGLTVTCTSAAVHGTYNVATGGFD